MDRSFCVTHFGSSGSCLGERYSAVCQGPAETVTLSPLGSTLPVSAGRQPSEIPSQTRSVSVFLPGSDSVGPRSFGDVRSGSCQTHTISGGTLICWFFRVFRGCPGLPASPPPTEGEGAGGGGVCHVRGQRVTSKRPHSPREAMGYAPKASIHPHLHPPPSRGRSTATLSPRRDVELPRTHANAGGTLIC